jgi:hypothetical protein
LILVAPTSARWHIGNLGVEMNMGDKSPASLVILFLGAALVVFFFGVSLVLAVGEQPVPTELWAAGGAISGALVGILVPAPAQGGAANVASAVAGDVVQNSALDAASRAVRTQDAATQPAATQALGAIEQVGDALPATRLLARIRNRAPRAAAEEAANTAVRLLGAEAESAAADIAKAEEDLATLEAGELPNPAAVGQAKDVLSQAEARHAVHDAAAAAAGGALQEATDRGTASASMSTPKTNAILVLGVVFFLALAVGIALAAGIITPSKGFEPTLQGAANTLITLAAAAGGALVGLFAPSSSGTSAAG